MAEIRKNAVTGELVIIAPERAARPTDHPGAPAVKALPQRAEGCPFCPGHEDRTPPASHTVPEVGPSDSGWQIRVFANKFSALKSEGAPARHQEGLKLSTAGIGLHEVIVESPRHDLSLADLDAQDRRRLMQVWHARTLAFYADERIEQVVLFKNHGAAAGSSLAHPHSQIIGLPLTPARSAARHAAAVAHHQRTSTCLICDVLAEALADEDRVVLATERLVVFVPFAALSPYHLWIIPRAHTTSFAEANPATLDDLGDVLGQVLSAMTRLLGDPPFNLAVQSPPPGPRGPGAALHWYVALVPRVTRAAGFELGSGMYINPSRPEESAARLRAALPEAQP